MFSSAAPAVKANGQTAEIRKLSVVSTLGLAVSFGGFVPFFVMLTDERGEDGGKERKHQSLHKANDELHEVERQQFLDQCTEKLNRHNS